METTLQDFRHAVRSLARRPGFTAVAVLSLALGIGGNALIDGLLDGFVLRPFPCPDPDRLVGIGVSFPKVSSEVVRSVAAASQDPPMGVFDTQFSVERQRVPGEGAIPTALITVATPSLFEALRVPLRAGRTFAASDRLDTPQVVIVNQTFASRYLPGVDPIGQRLAVGDPNQPRRWAEIVGVVADFRNGGPLRPVRPEIYMPM